MGGIAGVAGRLQGAARRNLLVLSNVNWRGAAAVRLRVFSCWCAPVGTHDTNPDGAQWAWTSKLAHVPVGLDLAAAPSVWMKP